MGSHGVTLAELMRRVGAAGTERALGSVLQYPRTETLDKGKPLMFVSQGALDMKAVQEAAESDTELRAMRFRGDVLAALGWLAGAARDLPLDRYDGIRLTAMGLNLVCVELPETGSGRTVVVNLDLLRGALRRATESTARLGSGLWLFGTFVAGVVMTYGLLARLGLP